jgi:inosine-uridine nucleoside N-ribohydrolase
MSRTFVGFVLLLCIGLSCGAFGLALPAAAQSPRPVIIDTDMALDDWLAILYVLNDPNFEVEAIKVTGTGFAYCDASVHIALGLVALTEYGDVPVSCWTETPLLSENAPPAEWRTDMDAAEALGLPEGGEASDQDAVALSSSTVAESAENVTVLALGPLTNVAAALDAGPSLVENIEIIYVMGGAVDVPGSGISEENVTAEWNIYCDPHAARLVFESGAPITPIPLDATNEAPITPEFLSMVEANQQTPEAEFVYTALTGVTESIQSGGYSFWDPLAAGVLGDPSIVTLTQRDVTVIDIPGNADDGRTKPVGNGSDIWVAIAPDVSALEQDLIETWNS